MENTMSFKIGSDKAFNQPYRYPKHATATCYWQFITFAGEEYIAGISKTNDNTVAASMCRVWNEEEDTVLEFCQALLRKAYGRHNNGERKPRHRQPKKNIFNREIIPTRETNPWLLVGEEELPDGSLGLYVWEFELKPTVKTENRRR